MFINKCWLYKHQYLCVPWCQDRKDATWVCYSLILAFFCDSKIVSINPQNSPLGIYWQNKRLCFVVLFLCNICMLLNSLITRPEKIYCHFMKNKILHEPDRSEQLVNPWAQNYSRWIILHVGFRLANTTTTLRGMQKQFCLKPPFVLSRGFVWFHLENSEAKACCCTENESRKCW